MSTMSMTANSVLTAQARESLRGKWGLAMGGFVVYFLASNVVSIIPFAGLIVSVIISGAFSLGLAMFALAIARGEDARVAMVFQGFGRFGVALGASLLMGVFVILWTLLLIIPGIIALLSYAQTYYIIADNESIGPLEAITRSKQIMRGNKGKLFCLGLRFFGWILLGCVTLGIGFLWIAPYMSVSFARFYEDMTAEHGGVQSDSTPAPEAATV